MLHIIKLFDLLEPRLDMPDSGIICRFLFQSRNCMAPGKADLPVGGP